MLQLNQLDKIQYIEGYDEANEEFFNQQDKAELDQMVQETANSIMDSDDPKWVLNQKENAVHQKTNEVLSKIAKENQGVKVEVKAAPVQVVA